MTCNVVSGDVNDIIAALMNAEVDMLILYRAAQIQVALPEEQYDCVEIGDEVLAPTPPRMWPIARNAGWAVGGARPFRSWATPRSRPSRGSWRRSRTPPLAPGAGRARGGVHLGAPRSGGGGPWRSLAARRRGSGAPAGSLRRIEAGGLSADLKIVAHRAKGASFPALSSLWNVLTAEAREARLGAVDGARR
ncbi:hypothetical protein ACRAWD_22490 [Caulobacter segnis]